MYHKQSVAYDRSSAPKDCRVSGMFGGQGTADVVFDPKKLFFLTQFRYDLEKSNAQTFSLPEDDSEAGPRVVDTIRLDFTSNHGSPSHTCIYRLRVHGREPNSVSTLPTRSWCICQASAFPLFLCNWCCFSFLPNNTGFSTFSRFLSTMGFCNGVALVLDDFTCSLWGHSFDVYF